MNKTAIVVIVIAAALAAGGYYYLSGGPTPEPPPVRNDVTLRGTESGEVAGFLDSSGARAWLGVPYAQPPVGTLRWKAPQPPLASKETIEALAYGNLCPQLASPMTSGDQAGETPHMAGDEDCLYLNIWSPPNAHNLPVMFWIHGGGNSIGRAADTPGGNLAVQGDVVVVSIHYRLGLLGWFSHPALATGDPVDDSGNYGLLDMVRALQWTRDNIASFGGDPGNITIFGESAGAFNSLGLIASPSAAGLFHRAIAQSGGYFTSSLVEAQAYQDEGGHALSAKELVNKLLVADGLATDGQDARQTQDSWSAERLRAYLYGQSAEALYAVLQGGFFGMISLPNMFADGHVLPALPTDAVFSARRNHNQVPVILGTNRDEPGLFLSRAPEYVGNLFGIFHWLKDEEAYKRQLHYGGRAWKARGADELAQHMAASGNPDLYVYRWDWDEEESILGYDLSVALGAAHLLEVPFVFSEFERGIGGALSYVFPDDEAQHALSRSMVSYWAEFAHNGNPGQGRNGAETPWLPWGKDGKTSLLLDTAADGGIRMDDRTVTLGTLKAELLADASMPALERCEFYVRTFRGSEHFDVEEYASLPGCADLPPESVSEF